MLKIRDIRIDSQINSAVTDNSAPEVSFALVNDVPDTFLRSAEVTVCGKSVRCGCRQPFAVSSHILKCGRQI